MNKVFLIGNLTKDAELTQTSSGISVCRFDLAVGRTYADASGERVTDFFKCTAWRGLAETIGKYCKKGNKVSVIGSVQLRDYEDNNGNKRSTVDIIVSEVEFLTQKASEGDKKPKLQEVYDNSDIPF